MSRTELPDEIYDRIRVLCAEGDQLAADSQAASAWERYLAALKLVPEPETDWEAATWILAAIGDLLFAKPDYARAREAFEDAVRCPGGLGNVFIHLRLGECWFELGDERRAADNPTRAYMGGGREAFAREDPKSFALLERVLCAGRKGRIGSEFE